MYHMFDIAVAEKVGIVAAVLFQNIAFWCQHSQANGTNYHDGLFWTYNSVKSFKELFPYLSAKQISTAIDKLINAGMIVKGNYNKNVYDRTMWYAITEKGKSIFQKGKMEIPEKENGFSQSGEPIPYINADINADTKPNISISHKRFEPPTVEQVQAYAKEKNWKDWQLNAERFVNFYASKGWKVGKDPMTDWKAAARGWVSRQEQPTGGKPQQTNPALNYVQRDYSPEAKPEKIRVLNPETEQWEWRDKA